MGVGVEDADVVASSALVTEQQEHVPVVADLPEVRNCRVFSRLREEGVFHQGAEILPLREVIGPE